MSAVAQLAIHNPWWPAIAVDPAIGPTADGLREEQNRIREDAESSAEGAAVLTAIAEELLDARREASEANWDGDGEISMEWRWGDRSIFSVSVGRDGQLTYAGLFGHSEVHGVEYMADGIPEAILSSLRRGLASCVR